MENFPKPNIGQKVQESIKPKTKEFRNGLAEDLKTLRDISPKTAQEFIQKKQEDEEYQEAREDLQDNRNTIIEVFKNPEKFKKEEIIEIFFKFGYFGESSGIRIWV